MVRTNRESGEYVEYVYSPAEYKKFLAERRTAEATHGGRVVAYNGQQDADSWLRLYHFITEVPKPAAAYDPDDMRFQHP